MPRLVVGRPALAAALLVLLASFLPLPSVLSEAGDSHTETVNSSIPDGTAGGGVTSTINVGTDVVGPVLTTTILFTVNVTHEYPGDLDIVVLPPWVAWPVPGYYDPALIPDGAVHLFAEDQTLPDGENLTNTRFTSNDDPIHDVGATFAASEAPYNGIFAASDSVAMDDIYDVPPQGDWTIIVMDTDAGDSGTLVSWAITFSDAQNIQVKDPSSNTLSDGDTVDLGIYDTGVATDSTWTVKDTTPTKELTVSNIEFRNAVNCTASISPTSFEVAGSTSETFTLTITATDNGAFSGRLRITSDDPDEEDFDITITGLAWFADGEAPDEPVTVGSGDDDDGSTGFTDPSEALTALETLGAAGRIDGPVELELAGGEYDSINISGPITGIDATNTLTISAADGETVTITGATATSAATGGSYSVLVENQSYVTLEGLEIDAEGGTGCIGVFGASTNVSTITIRNCQLTNCAYAIDIRGAGSTGFTVSDVRIEGNAIWGTTSLSSVFWDLDGTSEIVNNTFIATTGTAGVYCRSQSATLNRFSGNIVYATNTIYAMWLVSGVLPTNIDRNLYYTTGLAQFSDSAADFSTWQGLGADANGAEGDPLFVDPDDGDWHIQIGSPAIDLADDQGAPADIDGDTRTDDGTPDAGADEFVDPTGAEIQLEYEGSSFSAEIISSGESLDFGNLGDNEPIEFDFTISNSGATDLTLSGGPIDISDDTNVTVSVSQPSSTIGVGQSETFTLTVTARGFTTISGSTTISVPGDGLLLSTTDDQFADLSVGDSVTISGFSNSDNNGEATVTAIYDSDQGSGETNNLLEISGLTMIGESAGNSITISATTPRFTVTIPNNDSDESDLTFDVTGTYVATPEPSLTLLDEDDNSIAASGTDDVGNLPLSTAFTYEFTIRNDGTSALTLSGADYVALNTQTADITFTTTQPDTDGTLDPRESVTFRIEITLSATGTQSVTFDIVSDDPSNPTFTFTLQATGATVPIADFETEVDFGTISFYPDETVSAAGSDSETRITTNAPGSVTSATGTVVISNTGDATLTVELQSFTDHRGYWTYSGSSPSGATIGGGTFTIAAGSSETLTFVYEPAASVGAPFTATLVIDTDSGDGSGTVSGSPTTITFTGKVEVVSDSGGGCMIAHGSARRLAGRVSMWLLAAILAGLAVIRRRRRILGAA